MYYPFDINKSVLKKKKKSFEIKQADAHREIARLKKEVMDSREQITNIVKKSPDILRPLYVDSPNIPIVDYHQIFLKSGKLKVGFSPLDSIRLGSTGRWGERINLFYFPSSLFNSSLFLLHLRAR